MAEEYLQGLAASPGIAIGPVYLLKRQLIDVQCRSITDPESEILRLISALNRAREEIARLADRAAQVASQEEAAIFEAQRMILDDPEMVVPVQQAIRDKLINAEFAWSERSQYYYEILSQVEDEYIAARAADVQDVSQLVLSELLNTHRDLSRLPQPSIIVAEDLAPSDTVRLDRKDVLAFCTAKGGITSHAAILAKALGIPAVIALGPSLHKLFNSEMAIVDGTTGTIIIQPGMDTIELYRKREETLDLQRKRSLVVAKNPAITQDGVQVEVAANIGRISEVQDALENGAEGIGLLRTEFLFLDRQQPPDEEEQYQAYRAILAAVGPLPVVVRTLDIGGDKPAPYLHLASEENPFLGLRGLRLLLRMPELFETQMRALLRAGAGHNLKIMFPMVSTVDEVRQARWHLEQARATLRARGLDHALNVQVGAMIEVPGAALLAPVLAQEVDFFSLGTNDLSQYTMAADRGNGDVAGLADALQPAVLRLVDMVVRASHLRGLWVGICGELAGNPLAAPLLLGMGIDEFSMAPRSVPAVKQVIRGCSANKARQLAAQVLELENVAAIRGLLETYSSANVG